MNTQPPPKPLLEIANAATRRRSTAPDPPTLGDPVTVGVLVLAILAVIYALYVGREIILPIVLAVMLKLLLQPIADFMCVRLRIFPTITAVLLVALTFAVVAGIVLMISGPAFGWVQKAPEVLPALKQKLVLLRQPIDYLQGIFKELQEVVVTQSPSPGETAVAIKETPAVASKLAWSTVSILERLFATMVFLFFLIAAGDRLLRAFIEVLPRFSDKRQAASIASEIQHQIGGYLFMITLMNAAVGIATALAMWACGLSDPILWGTAAFMLNFVPILGPWTGIGMFLIVGAVVFEPPWLMVLPAGIYLVIHLAEGEVITPLLLAKRFTLNPVLVIGSVFFWYAVWGVPGALLAVPLLAIFKILCDRLEPLKPIGHIIGA